MKICPCRHKGMTDYRVGPAPQDWQALRAYYCNKCDGVAFAYSEKNVTTRAPRSTNCYPLSAHGKRSGQWIKRWRVTENGESRTIETVEFTTYDRKVPMENDEPMIFQLWGQLQGKVEVILREPNGPGDNTLEAQARERARYEARGMAELLATLMQPFMTSPDDVVRHAVKFFKNPEHDVPGLALHLWDPTKNFDGSPVFSFTETKVKPKPIARPKAAEPENTNKLDPSAVEKIKMGLESGVMDEKGFADLFNVSLKTLREAIQS